MTLWIWSGLDAFRLNLMADHENLHSQTHGPTSQFPSIPVSAQFQHYYRRKKNEQLNILTYWTRFWHGTGSRKPMTFLSSPSFARSWGVVPCNTTQLRKPNICSTEPEQKSPQIPQELHDFMLFRSCGEVKTCPRYCCTIPKITWLHAIPAICSGYVQDSN